MIQNQSVHNLVFQCVCVCVCIHCFLKKLQKVENSDVRTIRAPITEHVTPVFNEKPEENHSNQEYLVRILLLLLYKTSETHISAL